MVTEGKGSTMNTTTDRNRQITAASIRHAAEILEHACSELEAAQINADTSPGVEVDVWDAVGFGLEPEQMAQRLRELAASVEAV